MSNLNILYDNGFDVSIQRGEQHDKCETPPALYLRTYPRFMGELLGEDDFLSFIQTLINIPDQTTSKSTECAVIWGNNNVNPRPQRIWNILASK